MKAIRSKKIWTAEKFVDGYVIIENDRIFSVSQEPPEGLDELYDFGDCYLLPGFIDIHGHSIMGHDAMDGIEAVRQISLNKMKEGVTSFCPTTVTDSLKKTKAAICHINEATDKGLPGARSAGIFLEGPYISKRYKGAHVEELIRQVSLSELEELLKLGQGRVISCAIAPELPLALEAIKLMRSYGVIPRLGHTEATCAQANEAVELGATIAIHTYNAMSPLAHREPGMVGCVLTNDKIYAEIISDFIHVSKEAIEVVLRCKADDKVVLITDCMAATGLGDGVYTLGGQDVTVKDGVARTPGGNLAGSTLTMNQAVKNMYSMGVDLHKAIRMATANPAQALGLSDVGALEKGRLADVIALDDQFNVRMVMIGGERRI